MSMEIGGLDLPLLSIPREQYYPRLVLETVADLWPEAVYQNADETSWTPLAQLLQRDEDVGSAEFFVYRDETSAQDWATHGARAENANTMLHILSRDDPEAPGLV